MWKARDLLCVGIALVCGYDQLFHRLQRLPMWIPDARIHWAMIAVVVVLWWTTEAPDGSTGLAYELGPRKALAGWRVLSWLFVLAGVVLVVFRPQLAAMINGR